MEDFSIPLDWLIYDTTNFYSFLAEQTPSELYEKGKNKACRDHLRQVGLAVSVVRGLGLPLIHELYGGSQHDGPLFATSISRTIERVRKLSHDQVEEITVVFDKGNNSAENIQSLSQGKVHFIGSLSPSNYSDLCSIRLSRYIDATLANGRKVRLFDTKAHAFERSIRVVITYNEAAARKKEKRFKKDLGRALAELNLVRWAKVTDPEAKISALVAPKLPAYLFKTEGTGANLKVGLDQKAVTAYKKRFGKTLIFTDRTDMTALEVAQAYTDRNEFERLWRDERPSDISLPANTTLDGPEDCRTCLHLHSRAPPAQASTAKAQEAGNHVELGVPQGRTRIHPDGPMRHPFRKALQDYLRKIQTPGEDILYIPTRKCCLHVRGSV